MKWTNEKTEKPSSMKEFWREAHIELILHQLKNNRMSVDDAVHEIKQIDKPIWSRKYYDRSRWP